MTLLDLERVINVVRLLLAIIDLCKKLITKRTK